MFLRPEFLWLLLIWLPLCGVLLTRKTLPTGWASVIEPQLLNALSPPTKTAKLNKVVLPLLGVLVIIALSGPSVENGQQRSATQGQLMVLLDTSLSMAATDTRPSRLERAKRIIDDWSRNGLFESTSVIVYSGSAHTLVPLTQDTPTIRTQLQALNPFVMPAIGNQPKAAFELLNSTLANLPDAQHHLLWLTDDIDQADAAAIELPSNVASKSLIPLGTLQGSTIPLPDNRGNLKTNNGIEVIATTNLTAINTAADALGFQVLNTAAQPNALLLGEFQQSSETQTARTDIGFWLLIPITLLFLARSAHPSMAVALVLSTGVFFVPTTAEANSWFKNADQLAFEALSKGDADTALNTARQPDILAQALFEQQNYQQAAAEFNQLDTQEGYYNAGNALALAGDLESALAAYDQALEMGEHVNATKNRQIVSDAMQNQNQEQQQNQEQAENGEEQGQDQQNGKSGEQEPGDQDSEQSSSNPSEQNSNTQPEPSDTENEPSDSEQAEPEQESQTAQRPSEPLTAEQQAAQTLEQQAVEAVLNQLEADASLLLQRKFQFQQQQNPSDAGALEW